MEASLECLIEHPKNTNLMELQGQGTPFGHLTWFLTSIPASLYSAGKVTQMSANEENVNGGIPQIQRKFYPCQFP